MQRQLASHGVTLASLPQEVMMTIMSHLTLDDLANLSETNKQLWYAVNDEYHWRFLVEKHFPQRKASLTTDNYKVQFKKAFQLHYLSTPMKLELSGLFERVRTHTAIDDLLPLIQLADFHTPDGSGIRLIECAHELQNHAALEAIFQYILTDYTNQTHDWIPFMASTTPLAKRVDEWGNTLLIWAVRCNRLEWIQSMDKEFIETINIANHSKITPLHTACLFNMPAIARLLISLGADLSLQTEHHNTPLHVLAMYQPMKLFLTAAGIPFDCLDQQIGAVTLLQAAAIREEADNVQFLLERNASNIHAKSNIYSQPIASPDYETYEKKEDKLMRWNALHIAAWLGNLSSVKLLVKFGARINDECLLDHPQHHSFSPRPDLTTPLDLAATHPDVSRYLILNGGTHNKAATPFIVCKNNFDLGLEAYYSSLALSQQTAITLSHTVLFRPASAMQYSSKIFCCFQYAEKDDSPLFAELLTKELCKSSDMSPLLETAYRIFDLKLITLLNSTQREDYTTEMLEHFHAHQANLCLLISMDIIMQRKNEPLSTLNAYLLSAKAHSATEFNAAIERLLTSDQLDEEQLNMLLATDVLKEMGAVSRPRPQ